MAAAEVDTPGEHLWNFTRLKRNGRPQGLLFVALWTPIGVPLCALRVLLLVMCMMLYPPAHMFGVGRLFIRFVQPFLGVFMRLRGYEQFEKSRAPIIVSNHVSDFDACAMWGASPPAEQQLVVNEHWRPVISFARRICRWPINPIFTSAGDTKEALRATVGKDSPTCNSQTKLLIFPEGRTSSGITVMTFFPFSFSLGVSIIPCAMRVQNPWPIQMQMNGTSVLHNLVALFYLPFVFYNITFLPEMSAGMYGDADAYAEAVRLALCRQLDVPATRLSAKDKVAFGKQLTAGTDRKEK
jgi:1-acyl-sn-glycerol-3-phosphate acyltransferase|eukprot:TRINITY_DN596_c4_g1_i1.p1 TRINITY_DN596_c4_g1~~TRINITY_DN596_c4_g1_i1.p1  ORF type:complete len:309 (+),score=30.44 TRINITY_DN596_c4_g1_i1:37-927(+)